MKKNSNGWKKMGAGNYVLSGDGFFISYLPVKGRDPKIGIIDSIAALLMGRDMARKEETALVKKNGDDRDYLILNGDYRKDYERLVPHGYDECKKFYDTKKVEHKSNWSHDAD